jgi:hypothetical protein
MVKRLPRGWGDIRWDRDVRLKRPVPAGGAY